jgi:hypothetical protein
MPPEEPPSVPPSKPPGEPPAEPPAPLAEPPERTIAERAADTKAASFNELLQYNLLLPLGQSRGIIGYSTRSI